MVTPAYAAFYATLTTQIPSHERAYYLEGKCGQTTTLCRLPMHLPTNWKILKVFMIDQIQETF